jgi:uncharacterized protein YcnI
VAGVCLATGLVAVLVVASAAPAGAHATLNVSAVPINTVQSLSMDVPHERADTVYNVSVVVALPDEAGWSAVDCQAQVTWTCQLTTQDGRKVVRFAKNPGAPRGNDEIFNFRVQVPGVIGSFAFPTVQTYNTNETVYWIGAPGTPEPAPVLRTQEQSLPPQTSPPTSAPTHVPTPTTAGAGGGNGGGAAGGGGSSASPSPGDPGVPSADPLADVTTTLEPGATTTEDPAATTSDSAEGDDEDDPSGGDETATGPLESSDDGGSSAAVPLGLGAVAVLALGGGWLAWRQRSGASPTDPPTPEPLDPTS